MQNRWADEASFLRADDRRKKHDDKYVFFLGRFDVIICDPPWDFRLYSKKGEGKSPQAHYSCMISRDIWRLPISSLATADCWLFLCTSAPLLKVSFVALHSCGFTYKSRMSWRKVTAGEKVRMGCGYLVCSMHEDVLVASRGHPKFERALPSLFDGFAREHSRKPDEFYRLVEAFKPNARRLELFARESRDGWITWGNESTKFDEVV
jgi:N6-adenosine-specific RNA methylase IME4